MNEANNRTWPKPILVVFVTLIWGLGATAVLDAAEDEDAVGHRDLIRAVEDEPRLRISWIGIFLMLWGL